MQKQHRVSVSPEERNTIGFLASEMERYQAKGRPPMTELANKAFNATFLATAKRSPLFEGCLRGMRLADLGAGNPHAMIAFADHYLAGEYVAVDSHRDYSGLRGMLASTRFLKTDMLRYLGNEPDCSSNLVLNNIDRAVLLMDDPVFEEAYRRMLVWQMARVVPPGGIAFGLGSPLLHDLADLGFEKMEHTGAYVVGESGAIYKKK